MRCKGKLLNSITQLTDQCVKCGMCVPSCPTYQIAKNENESPRGRISLLEGLAKQQIEPTAKLREHLDNCLSCGKCQQVCPSKVQYFEILQLGKNYLFDSSLDQQQATVSGLLWLRKWFYSARKRYWLHWFLYIYSKLGGRRLINYLPKKWFGNLPRLTSWLPTKINQPINYQKFNLVDANLTKEKTVGLLTGCMLPVLDSQLISSAIKILKLAGYQVILADQLGCCGGLELQRGNLILAEQLRANNLAAIAAYKNKVDCWLSLTPGCQNSWQWQFAEQEITIIDIQQFLLTKDIDNNLINLTPANILVFNPCSQRNMLNESDLTERFLAKFRPNGVRVTVPIEYGCCGAGGGNLLNNSPAAGDLIAPIIAFIQQFYQQHQDQTNIICCSNLGCAIHLQRYLSAKQIELEVIHPWIAIFHK